MSIRILKASFFLLLLMLFVRPEVADGEERFYYSIHFASFKQLENANRQVNALKEKGKMVFWRKADVPGKGQYYRVYLGRYYNRDEAVAFWNKLNDIGAVGYFGIHRFTETVEPEKIKDLAKISVSEEPDAGRAVQTPPAKDRFVDNQDGTITDTKTNLMWIQNGWRLDFFAAETWTDAKKKCENFKLGGYSDWRLPTVEEWRSLIDPDRRNPAMIEPNPFENIIAHMPYWTHSEFTYSRDRTCIKQRPLETFTVLLYSGSVNHQKKTDRAFILPVRSLN
ncbi:MAG: DUF1566 domain-containing protein [Desulfobacterales bacterium]|uniref:DUF1566 domain-containing protein n=1 Tax=Candidatus Desulfatibia profunda TaxID=2841695 RepID=A0A8J6NQL7_9BACT|nr:DUF1566 domain-containing protein [Candidatus Desulfatibia profunda]MBL7181236.1 DUF1566 domain-containing protein [Desulfobacterales bacterium]